jgi:putative thioredoxin
MSSYIIDVTSENFSDAVLSNSHKGPVMVNYWAENAGPCLRLWPVLEKLANDYNGQFLLANWINTWRANLTESWQTLSLNTRVAIKNRPLIS